MSEVTQFSSGSLKEWLEKETVATLGPVQVQAKKFRDETAQAISALNEVCESLLDNSVKEIEKRNMKVYNRARALNKLAHLFIDRLSKLSVPEQVTFDSLSKYNIEVQRILMVTEIDIKIWFPKISPFFIMDRRKFITVYDKTKQTFITLNEFVTKEYVKTKTLQETLQLISDLQGLETKLSGLEAEVEGIKSERTPVEEKIAGLMHKTGELHKEGPMDQLKAVGVEIETLSNELKNTLRHMQKPFIKMQALSMSGGGGGIAPDELRLINLYLDKPFEALVVEERGYSGLKAILGKLQGMLKEDKLKLKPDKARKAEQSILEMLNKNLLSDVQEKCKALSLQKEQLLTSAHMGEVKHNLSVFEEQLEQLRVKKSSIEANETIKKRECQDFLCEINNRKRVIERNIASAFAKTVQII